MTDEEKEIYLNSYKWIKVKRFRPDEYSKDELYDALEKHHLEETNFLINKVRELIELIPTTDSE